jgi:hypothetical protein
MTVFQEGFKDFGKGQLVNPHKVDTEKHRNWELGFNKAYFKNLEKVKQRETRQDVKNIGAGSNRVQV